MPFVQYPLGSGARIWAQGEVPFYESLHREKKVWPPPHDWLPHDERSLRLIQGY